MQPVLASVGAVLGCGAAVYCGLCALLYLRQDRLLFYPGPNDPVLARAWETRRVEIPTPGGAIEAFWADNPQAATPAVILYFGGNAEDVLYTAETAPRFAARRLLFANYRGFGKSAGRPSQPALYEDALAIYDHVVSHERVPPQDVVVMGRSLGSGVATWLASQRPVRAVILVTPFDSMVAVARGHYPIFPVGWLLRHRFPSDELARALDLPVVMLAAEGDSIIPPSHAVALHAVWAGEKSLHVLPGVDHNDVERHPAYHSTINAFLRGTARSALAR